MHSFQHSDPLMKWAAQECGSGPLETTITRVTGVLIKTSRGRLQELTDLEGSHLFLRDLIRSCTKAPDVLEAISLRSVCSASWFETVLTAHWIFTLEPPFSWCKYEFYDEALIMYVITNSFFASQGRLWEQIPVLLQRK